MPPLEHIIPAFIVLLISLSFHEAAHAWTADKLGDPTARQLGRITMNPIAHIDPIGTILFPLIAMMSNVPLLGWAKPVPVSFENLKSPRRDFAIIAAAGPISNLILAAGVAIIYRVMGGVSAFAPSFLDDLMARALMMNVLLAVFNMIPVPPLDGGNVLMGVLPESMARVVDLLRPWGFLILYVLLFTGVLNDIVVPIAYDIMRFLVL